MPARTGQLDEISQAIGRLEGKVDALDVYTHEREHNIDNLRAMVNGLSAQMSRDVASAKGEISATLSTAIERVEARMQTIDDRVSALETATGFISRRPLPARPAFTSSSAQRGKAKAGSGGLSPELRLAD
jgi:uncharacterized membrane-anchored protein